MFNYFLFICFTSLRIESAQSNVAFSLKNLPILGRLNDKRCTHLCTSFTTPNQKYYPNFISRYSRYKLNMGCDYYIDKNLQIYNHDNTMLSFINLEHDRGYFWFTPELDEDEDGDDEEVQRYVKSILESTMKPIVIYSNNAFYKPSFENKYKILIENELKTIHKTWSDVNNIVKIESRYER